MPRSWNRRRVFALCVLSTTWLFVSCLFETKEEDASKPGYVRLDLSLKAASSALAKTASSDTVFSLDSLIVVLSASGAATITNSYAISGRADAGTISVSTQIYTLASLRTWTAKFYSIDTSVSPVRRDTVHIDSVSFSVNPGDTAVVTKTINPVFSILRARFVSDEPDSLASTVKYVRIRVDGTTCDSAVINPTLRFTDFGNASNGYIVGDAGTILRSTNSGATWTPAAAGTTEDLYCVNMTGANAGFACGANGAVVHTTNGTSWSAITSGVTSNLYATYWANSSNGWIAGAGGLIRKSTNGTSFTTEASGTTRNLNGMYFTSGSAGYVVGDSGTIARTTNGGTAWSLIASGVTTDLNAVMFPVAATGYTVGDGGVILKTTNNGAAWSALTSGVTANLNGVTFTNANNGWVSGDGGLILYTTNGGTSWSAASSGTTQNLYGICWSTNGSAIVTAGTAGAALNSTNGTSWTDQTIVGSRAFDVLLTYKYLRPATSHTLIMQAIDTLSGTLRGYQVSKTVNISAGKDTTLSPSSGLTKCGYSGFSSCTP